MRLALWYLALAAWLSVIGLAILAVVLSIILRIIV